MIRKISKNFVIASVLASSVAFEAFASEEKEKNKFISGESVFEFQIDNNFRSKDKAKQYVDTFGRSEAAIDINLGYNFKIESNFVLEKINEAEADHRDRFFAGEGIFTEELKLRYSYKDFSIFGGKFNPEFGRAWDWGRGIWTHKIAEEYEQTEKLGGGFTASLLNHNLEVTAFHDDIKVFDGALISKRGEEPSRNDGAVGNTDNFKSYNIAISSEDAFEIKGLSYNFAYLNLATDDPEKDNQKGIAVGANYVFDLNKDITLDNLIEYTAFSDFEGSRGQKAKFITANTILTFYKNWNTTIGFSRFDKIIPDSDDESEQLYQISAGYKFDEKSILKGLTFEVGYKHQSHNDSNNDIATQTLGILSRYKVEF